MNSHRTMVRLSAAVAASGCLFVSACATDIDNPGGGPGTGGVPGVDGGTPGTGGNGGSGGAIGVGGMIGPKPTVDNGTRGTPLIGLGTTNQQQGMCATPGIAPLPLRRISRIEYNNAVAQLFGVTARPADGFVPEEKAGAYNSFGSNIVTTVSSLAIEQYLTGGETVADAVAANVTSATGCASASDATCVKNFLSARARRAWRGVFPAEERTDLLAKYDAAVMSLGAVPALRLGVISILLSPRFLFQVETGGGGTGVATLAAAEVASRLASVIWRSVPDDALLNAADAGSLASAAGVMTEARRMLDTPLADSMLADFARQWLEITDIAGKAKDNAVWPTYTTELARDLVTQSEMVFQSAVRGGGTFTSLLTSDKTMASSRIASFYGLPAVSGSAFATVTLPADRRGILTDGSVLASHSHFARPSVVLRGKFVRTQLLCDPIPSPPANVDTTVKPLATGQTERDLAAAHLTRADCMTCHTRMDPIGNGFEQFDAVGKFIGTAGGTGQGQIAAPTLTSMDDVSGTFAGPAALGTKLAGSEHARKCFAIQLLRYGLGRDEGASDACSAAQLWKQFLDGGYALKEAIVALTGTDSFRFRYYPPAGGSCR